MITQTNYINKVEHIWYNSSNVVYTACYDNDTRYKSLKVVFKEGRTYLYKNVDMDDYIMFARGAESTGEMLNKYIVKKYKGVRMPDSDLESLESMRKSLLDESSVLEQATSNLAYELQIDDKSGRFRLILNGTTILEGIEGQVSVMRLLKAMCIGYKLSELQGDLLTEDKFDEVPVTEVVQKNEDNNG